jgi:phage head maturation protease
MKKTIKLTKKLVSKYDLDIDIDSIPEENRVIKRISIDSEPVSADKGIVEGNISTIDIDSDGDVILPSAFDFERYKKNPVVLFNHSLNSPVGYAEKISVLDDRVTAITRFGNTAEAQKVYQLVKDRVLRTFSVGFLTLESIDRGDMNFKGVLNRLVDEYPHRFNAESIKSVDRIVTKAILIEYSIVTVPANEHAVVEEIKAIKLEEQNKVEEVEEVEEVIEVKAEQYLHTEQIVEDLTTEKVEVDEEPFPKEENNPAKEEVQPVVEELTTEEVDPEPEPEEEEIVGDAKIEIKRISRATKLKKVSTIEQEEQKRLNELYKSLWGI